MSNEQINFNGANESLGLEVDSAFSHQKTLARLLENAEKVGDLAKISEINELIKLNKEKIKELDKLYAVQRPKGTTTPGLIDFDHNGLDRFEKNV